MRVATDDERHSGPGMRTPFTRLPRNRPWRPPSYSLGSAAPKRVVPTRWAWRRRQGCQRRSESTHARGKKTPSDASGRAPKWEARREARFSPVSFAAGGPEPPVVCSRASSDGREQHAKKTFAWSGTEPRGSGTRATVAQRRKASREQTGKRESVSRGRRCAGKRRSTSARVGTVSECRSRSDAPPVATPEMRASARRTGAT